MKYSRKKVTRDVNTTTDSEDNYRYKPLFDNESKVTGSSRLLITGPEHIKVSVENHINSDEKFNGHTFMVNVNDE